MSRDLSDKKTFSLYFVFYLFHIVKNENVELFSQSKNFFLLENVRRERLA